MTSILRASVADEMSKELSKHFEKFSTKVGEKAEVLKEVKKEVSLFTEAPEPEALPDGYILASSILKGLPKGLPDFPVRLFEAEHWTEQARQLIPNPNDRDIKNYVIPLEAGYWFLYSLAYNKPVFLTGVKGCGKSSLAKKVASLLNWPFLRKQMSKDMDSSEFFGTWVVTNGSTEFMIGDLPQSVLGGYIMMWDEISNAPCELHPALHQVLEPGGSVYLNSSAGDVLSKTIARHPDFRIVATDNTKGRGDSRGMYAGTDVMNSATLDRFLVMIPMDYMSEAEEVKALIHSVTGLTKPLAKLMVKLAVMMRKAYDKRQINETLSMRGLLEWAEKLVFCRNISASFTVTVLNKLDDPAEVQEVLTYLEAVFGDFLTKS